MHSEDFPRLIMAQLSAWGLTGDEIGSPGYDLGAWWARGGVMHPEKERQGQLQPQHPAVGDHATGAFLAGGVGFALLHRQRTGRGQLVDASLQHSGVWCNAWLIVSAASDPELGELRLRPRRDADTLTLRCVQRGGGWETARRSTLTRAAAEDGEVQDCGRMPTINSI